MCRGKVSVKGKGQMLTYFLEGRNHGKVPPQSQPRNPGGRSSRARAPFARASVCTRLSPTPAVTAYGVVRTPGPVASSTPANSAMLYLPSASVPSAMEVV